MIEPVTFYNREIEKYNTLVSSLKKQLFFLSSMRLLVFVLTAVLIYMTFSQWKIALVVSLVGVIVFVFLLSKYTDVKSQHKLNKALLEINEEEIKIASNKFQHRDPGIQFQDPNHFYSLDIDLFGKGSFFQYLNRTCTTEGTFQLAELLKGNNISEIQERQKAVLELSQKTQWTQLFTATGSLLNTETPAHKITYWLRQHKRFIPKEMKWFPWVFSILSIALLILAIYNILDISFFGYWLFLGLAITGVFLRNINKLANNSDKAKDTFRQYASLLLQIENETFTSELLREQQQKIRSKHKKASLICSEFSKYLDALDNRNNLIGAIFGNGYLLSDIKNAYRVEQWISKYKQYVEDWFEVISFFDAYNSLGTYAFNHSDHKFPKIVNNQTIINARELGHPLINKTNRINSPLHINDKQFFIVTGANMAGKSTFLRTVSLHIMMANSGLPVCAKYSEYSPVKLITSMRTTDSLTDNSSYFFSELMRLKFIVDTIKAEEPYFIVLDEILKGTNSTDKAIGSKKFVEKLVSRKTTGIIATHDLSLCEISKTLEEVKNYYFDAEIINDELHFDYKLKEGICQNMNASFLLKKMEIV